MLNRSFAGCLNAAIFKGLGHAVLGSFSTDQMVIEFTKITITAH